ncbi:uncharacterized protein [Rutidosis leptorrhynchoides]|uniref:uncharacterized protein n=1 Tax=Rutidosis leptorrhynchoides TaxID=125765 RepID=UPI003A98F4EC
MQIRGRVRGIRSDRCRDVWFWKLATNGKFKTKILARLIDENTIMENRFREETFKNNLVSGKVGIFIWRVLKNRLPTHIELDKRGIDLDSVRCPLCDDGLESIDHALLFCKHSFEVWDRVYKWWNLGPVTRLSINEAFRGENNHSMSWVGCQIWQALEWTCAYLIWKNRNSKVFSNKSWNGPMALMEIQLKTFEWITSHSNKLKID